MPWQRRKKAHATQRSKRRRSVRFFYSNPVFSHFLSFFHPNRRRRPTGFLGSRDQKSVSFGWMFDLFSFLGEVEVGGVFVFGPSIHPSAAAAWLCRFSPVILTDNQTKPVMPRKENWTKSSPLSACLWELKNPHVFVVVDVRDLPPVRKTPPPPCKGSNFRQGSQMRATQRPFLGSNFLFLPKCGGRSASSTFISLIPDKTKSGPRLSGFIPLLTRVITFFPWRKLIVFSRK